MSDCSTKITHRAMRGFPQSHNTLLEQQSMPSNYVFSMMCAGFGCSLSSGGVFLCQLKAAAGAVGEADLENNFAAASASLRRGIMFANSLYL